MNLVDERLYEERQNAEYLQSVPSKSFRIEAKPYLQIMEKIDQQVPETERGDLLIFVSGLQDISTLADEIQLYADHTQRWIVLKLHSTLAIKEQDKVFDIAPPGVRKCIISTNIAETSVTIDGVRFIIDSGRVKELDFDMSTNLHRLSNFWISKASAKQRAGRAGRTGPGECYRLYSERELNHLNDFSIPEILRAPLDQLCLQMKAMDLGDPKSFNYVERPPENHLDHSLTHLQNLGALDPELKFTLLGHALSLLPVDSMIGKMLLLGSVFDILGPILIIAAGMSVQSPFKRQFGDLSNESRQFESEHGDPFTLLTAFQAWIDVKANESGGEKSWKWCRRVGIEEQRMYEMLKLTEQFRCVLQANLGIASDDHLCVDGDNRVEKMQSRKEAYYKWQRFKSEQMGSGTKRRKLRIESNYEIVEQAGQEPGDEEPEEDDIHAVEFSMRHDARSLRERVAKFRLEALTTDTINMIKLILCSGIYPNLAFPDDANAVRKNTEQVFHTKLKRFVMMHPSSVFATNPEWLQKSTKNVFELTNIQEFIPFVQILETTKPYLMNTFRVSALPAAMLFSRTIETSPDFTTLLCDGWILIEFRSQYYDASSSNPDRGRVEKYARQSLDLITSVRESWVSLLALKLTRNDESSENLNMATLLMRFPGGIDGSSTALNPKVNRRDFLEDIKQVLKMEEALRENRIIVTVTPLHPSQIDTSKAKQSLKPFLNVGSLSSVPEKPQARRVCECRICQKAWMTTEEEFNLHVKECMKTLQIDEVCPRCGGYLGQTPLDKLRHKSECSQSNKNNSTVTE